MKIREDGSQNGGDMVWHSQFAGYKIDYTRLISLKKPEEGPKEEVEQDDKVAELVYLGAAVDAVI
ncbi:hypothetical protein GQX74_015044 [Glossina fuscipes]|nr:hypothetical protein GQX74_015044 [Glossina fuscipes]